MLYTLESPKVTQWTCKKSEPVEEHESRNPEDWAWLGINQTPEWSQQNATLCLASHAPDTPTEHLKTSVYQLISKQTNQKTKQKQKRSRKATARVKEKAEREIVF